MNCSLGKLETDKGWVSEDLIPPAEKKGNLRRSLLRNPASIHVVYYIWIWFCCYLQILDFKMRPVSWLTVMYSSRSVLCVLFASANMIQQVCLIAWVLILFEVHVLSYWFRAWLTMMASSVESLLSFQYIKLYRYLL